MKRFNQQARLLMKHVVGWFCIAAGIIMCVTPGQGILTFLIGVYLLSDEILFFSRFKIRMENRFPKISAFVRRHTDQLRIKIRRR